MYSLTRSLLFTLPAEASHDLSMCALQALGAMPGTVRPLPGNPVQAFGLRFANPVGLAAGLDKDAVAVIGLARLGFGFIEVGTVTPRPQAGNPKPRLFRLQRDKALINRMGFNNEGVDAMVRRLDALRREGRLASTRLGVNIGKNKDTPLAQASQDYVCCYRAVAPYADYVTVNLSSPNTPGLRDLQRRDELERLLEPLRAVQAQLPDAPPLLVKLAPDLDEQSLTAIADVLRLMRVDGVIATNTTIERPQSLRSQARAETGGLSGAPLHTLALSRVRVLRSALGPDVPLIGVGGIDGAEAAAAHVEAGADLVQIYTGFIYKGPALVREIVQALHRPTEPAEA